MTTFKRSFQSHLLRIALTVGGLGMVVAGGCEHKEKVLDIKGPGVDIEVNRTTGGKHEVEINKNGKRKIEIETNK